mgnify:CR=1 FL=1
MLSGGSFVMKITRIKKSTKGSLYNTFLMMTLTPLFAFGILMTIFSAITLTRNIQKEASNNLKNVAVSTLAAYDVMYPGDINVLINEGSGDIAFFKGETDLTDNTKVIDEIKENSDVEISIFFYNTRMLTTIRDDNGEELKNTLAADQVLDEVIGGGREKFYNNVKIGRLHYYAYYMPIYSLDKRTCLGMIGVAKPTDEIDDMVKKSIYSVIAITLLCMLLTALLIVRFSSGIMTIVQKILNYLSKTGKGNLDAELDPVVQSRDDELGEIGRYAVKLQLSLKKLIERDELTGLYNRRTGERKMDKLEERGSRYSVAIGDIDFFKKFNDNFGHACGDAVLRAVAATLNEGVNGLGFVARWGGEEFLLVFEDMDEVTAGVHLNDILTNVREKEVDHNGEKHFVTMTFGVSDRKEGETIGMQIRSADDKLYEGKKSGRNRVIVRVEE